MTSGLRARTIRLLLLLFTILGNSVLSAHTPFPLTVSFQNRTDDKIQSDLGGSYDGVSNRYGNIVVDLRGSSRKVCFSFTGAPILTFGGLNPSLRPRNTPNDCYSALVQTLATTTYGGVTDLDTGDDSKRFSIEFYWTGVGADNLLHDYNLAFRQRNDSGVLATHPDDMTWMIDSINPNPPPLTGIGRVSVYLKGKGGGWNELADYEMPFQFIATR